MKKKVYRELHEGEMILDDIKKSTEVVIEQNSKSYENYLERVKDKKNEKKSQKTKKKVEKDD